MMQCSVFIGLGSNLPTASEGTPREVLMAALAVLADSGRICLLRRSRWWRSRPEPPSPQPWFVNGVIEIATALPPAPLLALLHEVEARFGRLRRQRNEARTLDLDLLAYGQCVSAPSEAIVLPHPRLHLRRFVLAPFCEIAPTWWHPRLRRTAAELLATVTTEEETVLPDED